MWHSRTRDDAICFRETYADSSAYGETLRMGGPVLDGDAEGLGAENRGAAVRPALPSLPPLAPANGGKDLVGSGSTGGGGHSPVYRPPSTVMRTAAMVPVIGAPLAFPSMSYVLKVKRPV